MGSTKSVPIDESSEGRREMEHSMKKSPKRSSNRPQVSSRRKKHVLPGLELEDNFDMVMQIQAAEAKRKQMKKEEKERKREQLERERVLARIAQRQQ